MKITIDLELSPLQKRIVRSAVVIGAVVGALGIGLAIAAPKHTFQANTALSSGDMNDNFTDLDTRLASVEQFQARAEKFQAQATADGGYSLGATYCGTTPSATTGFIQSNGKIGYAAAKDLCKAVVGCNAAAHMCTNDEVVRTFALGQPIPSTFAWTASAVRHDTASLVISDCTGYEEAIPNHMGPVAEGSQNHFSGSTCDQTNPILCCN